MDYSLEHAADFEEMEIYPGEKAAYFEEPAIYPGEKMSTRKQLSTFGLFMTYRINKLKDERPTITYMEARKVASDEWIKYNIKSLLNATEA